MKRFLSQNRDVAIVGVALCVLTGQPALNLARSERYDLLAAFLIAIIICAGVIVSVYRDSKNPSRRVSPLMKLWMKLWRMPFETTRVRLWMTSGFITLMCLALYSGFSYGSWVDDDEINFPFMIIDVMKVLIWLPFWYWSFRKQYSPDCPRKPSSRETLLYHFGLMSAFRQAKLALANRYCKNLTVQESPLRAKHC